MICECATFYPLAVLRFVILHLIHGLISLTSVYIIGVFIYKLMSVEKMYMLIYVTYMYT